MGDSLAPLGNLKDTMNFRLWYENKVRRQKILVKTGLCLRVVDVTCSTEDPPPLAHLLFLYGSLLCLTLSLVAHRAGGATAQPWVPLSPTQRLLKGTGHVFSIALLSLRSSALHSANSFPVPKREPTITERCRDFSGQRGSVWGQVKCVSFPHLSPVPLIRKTFFVRFASNPSSELSPLFLLCFRAAWLSFPL